MRFEIVLPDNLVNQALENKALDLMFQSFAEQIAEIMHATDSAQGRVEGRLSDPNGQIGRWTIVRGR